MNVATQPSKPLASAKPLLKTPITYYGGKQSMLAHILPRIPDHQLYCEPFIGGGAVFFAKPPSPVEVINDTNRELINFYEVVQNDFVSLEKEVRITLHSRSMFNDAKVIYNSPHLFPRMKRAWAVWALAAQGFAAQLDGTWGYDRMSGGTSKKIHNKRESFSEEYAIRLQNVQIEATDAIRVINSRDNANAFFYCDPPYYNSDCGHYDGYSMDDFERLLQTLAGIKGKFLLSSYPSPVLKEYTKRHKWHTQGFEGTVSVAAKSKHVKKKIEVLTANYEI